EGGVAIASARHEIVGRDLVRCRILQRLATRLDRQNALTRGPACVGFDDQTRDLRETAGGLRERAKPVFDRGPEVLSADLDQSGLIAEWQFGQDIAPADGGVRRI